MTMKEYAHSCVEELKKLPTQKTVVKVCNRILHAQVDGRDITSSEVEIILGYIEDEIGDYGFLNENFDNHEMLTLMSQRYSGYTIYAIKDSFRKMLEKSVYKANLFSDL